uniref:Uncharacterized protein n=1 Tax=Peronospora matthiolae TaxID=2874970 RepID=A0AAV1T6W0_9STRA
MKRIRGKRIAFGPAACCVIRKMYRALRTTRFSVYPATKAIEKFAEGICPYLQREESTWISGGSLFG